MTRLYTFYVDGDRVRMDRFGYLGYRTREEAEKKLKELQGEI